MIVHIVPTGVFANTWHGSYKDTISRVRLFEQAGVEYRQIRVDEDDPGIVPATVARHPDVRFLIEYTVFPHMVKGIRREFPQSFIAVRSHNLEPLQHLDNHGWWPRRGPLWLLYGMARLASADVTCKRYADAIYSISDWENRVYWRHLPGLARTEWLPYHCPQHLLPDVPPASRDRRHIACLPTSQKGRKSWDLVTRFLDFAQGAAALPSERNGWEFVVTGNLTSWGLPRCPNVRFAGLVDDLRDFLSSCRAVAILSPLGYGFKTTVADAIAHGCYVLAHPALVRRCPDVLRPAIIPFDPTRPHAIAEAMVRLESPLPLSGVDAELRASAHALLARDFAIVPRQFSRREAF